MSTSGEIKGFLKDRFIDKSDSFDCNICFMVARDPYECLGCGQIYCKNCQDNWKNECGCYTCVKCDGSTMHNLNQHLMEVYSQLKYKCACNQIFTLLDIPKHEELCNQPNCKYFAHCNRKVSTLFKKQNVCSSTCLILELTQQNIKDQNKLYKLIMGVLKQQCPVSPPTTSSNSNMVSTAKFGNSMKQESAPNIPIIPYIQIKNSFPNTNMHSMNAVQFKWHRQNKGDNIEIQNDGFKVHLKESQYVFKSVVSDIPFEKGQHYFEIVIDAMTENELKIGIVTNNTFNKNTAFCDSESGFGYYTTGKLRNGSNAHGSDYGQKFKNSGICGVFLDMNKGVLAFSYNGISQGVAFKTNILTKSPLFASVSLLHCAGFTLKSGLAIPPWANNLG